MCAPKKIYKINIRPHKYSNFTYCVTTDRITVSTRRSLPLTLQLTRYLITIRVRTCGRFRVGRHGCRRKFGPQGIPKPTINHCDKINGQKKKKPKPVLERSSVN